MRRSATALLLACALGGLGAPAHAQDIRVTIDGAKRAAPVTRHAYGMFIEPIGGLVARTLWAELLDDRKFYHPVVPETRDVPPPPNAEGRPGVAYRKWRPVGGDDAVSMDLKDPFVGRQSPSVTVGAAPRGLAQAGLGVAGGRRYVGSLWLSGDATAGVEVALVWGAGPGDRQAVKLPAARAGWQRAEFAFMPGADAADARLEIIGTGSGRFRVAAISLMPADNIDGWRADTTAIAKSLNSGFWRLPGGNFLSDWDWHGALGARGGRAGRCSIMPGARCSPTTSAWTSGCG